MRKIFFKYLRRYVLIILIMVLGSSFMFAQSYKNSKNQLLIEKTQKVEQGLDILENNISRISVMTDMLYSYENTKKLKSTSGTLKKQYYTSLTALQKQIKDISYVYDFADNIIMLFRDTTAFISGNQVDGDFNSYYGRFFEYGNMSKEEFISMLAGQKRVHIFFPCEDIKYFKDAYKCQKALLLACHPYSSRAANKIDYSVYIMAIINTDKVRSLFIDDASIEGMELLYVDEKIMTGGKELPQEDKNVIECVSSAGELKVRVYYPEISGPYHIMDMMGRWSIYFLNMFIIAVLLSFYFSYKQYRKMLKLFMNAVNYNQGNAGEGKNEYEKINNVMDKIAADRDNYKNRIYEIETSRMNSILEIAFVNGIYTKEQEAVFKKCCGNIEYFCVIVMDIQCDDEKMSTISMEIETQLYKKLNGKNRFYSILSGGSKEIILIELLKENSSNSSWLNSFINDITGEIDEKYDAVIKAGISAVGQGINNIHFCYNQAQQVIYNMSENSSVQVENYYDLDESTKQVVINQDFLIKLKNLISSGNREAVFAEFDRFSGIYRRNYAIYERKKAELFFSIISTEKAVLQQQSSNDFSSVNIVQYRNNTKFSLLLEELKYMAGSICDALNEQRSRKSDENDRKLLEYLDEHFTDNGLTAAAVAEAFDISEKKCVQIIKNITGVSLSAYLETKRIEYAQKLLIETDMSNMDIAESAGFGSSKTFYRLFLKAKGVTPKVYRDSYKK